MVKMIEPQTKPKISQQTRRIDLRIFHSFAQETEFHQLHVYRGSWDPFLPVFIQLADLEDGQFFFHLFPPEKVEDLEDLGGFWGPWIFQSSIFVRGGSFAKFRVCFSTRPRRWAFCFRVFEQKLTDLDRYSSIGTIDTQTVDFFKPTGILLYLGIFSVPFHPKKKPAAFTTTSGWII